MKTKISTESAGTIEISNKFLGDKKWDIGDKNYPANYNNHKVTVVRDGKRMTFDFWQSRAQPDMTKDRHLIFALHCVLQDAFCATDSFERFCSELGYDQDSRKAEKFYKACEKALIKVERVFDGVELTDLINELQETYNV